MRSFHWLLLPKVSMGLIYIKFAYFVRDVLLCKEMFPRIQCIRRNCDDFHYPNMYKKKYRFFLIFIERDWTHHCTDRLTMCVCIVTLWEEKSLRGDMFCHVSIFCVELVVDLAQAFLVVFCGLVSKPVFHTTHLMGDRWSEKGSSENKMMLCLGTQEATCGRYVYWELCE